MKRRITISTSQSTRYTMKSAEQIIRSIDGHAHLAEIISEAYHAGYDIDVSDLMNIDISPKVTDDSIWLPTIQVRTLTYNNKLSFNVKCNFPELNEDESYHIKHWISEWSKVAIFVDRLTRFEIDLRQFINN